MNAADQCLWRQHCCSSNSSATSQQRCSTASCLVERKLLPCLHWWQQSQQQEHVCSSCRRAALSLPLNRSSSSATLQLRDGNGGRGSCPTAITAQRASPQQQQQQQLNRPAAATYHSTLAPSEQRTQLLCAYRISNQYTMLTYVPHTA